MPKHPLHDVVIAGVYGTAQLRLRPGEAACATDALFTNVLRLGKERP